MSLTDWSNEKVLQLIAECESQPELWDPNHPCFRNKFSKKQAWQTIAKNLKSTAYEVERKFKILLVQYRRERARISKMARNPDEIKRMEINAWYAYKAFDFLQHKYKLKTNVYNQDVTCDSNDAEYQEIKIEPDPEDYVIDYSGKNDLEDRLETAMEELPIYMKRKRSNSEFARSKYNDDDLDLFLQYVGSEMRNLSNLQIRKKLKRQILKAVLEAGEEDDALLQVS